jgi:hypothetical protein
MGNRTFKIFLIKPSHYDDDGYVIQWRLSTIPSNSLASVYGLLAACREERALGPDVDIEIDACDECNTVIDVKAISRRIKAAGGGFVGLVGVQSNQFPRALDLAREFRAKAVPVVIGGFHVSGCISMLPELPSDLKEAQSLGVTLYAGEGEGRMADLIRDIDTDQAKPLYNYLNDMPGMEAAAIPVLPKEIVDAVARSSAASARSSMSRAASRVIGAPMTSKRLCAPITPRASTIISSPTTISPGTATGRRS